MFILTNMPVYAYGVYIYLTITYFIYKVCKNFLHAYSYVYCEEEELKSKITIKKDVSTETYSPCLMNKLLGNKS